MTSNQTPLTNTTSWHNNSYYSGDGHVGTTGNSDLYQASYQHGISGAYAKTSSKPKAKQSSTTGRNGSALRYQVPARKTQHPRW